MDFKVGVESDWTEVEKARRKMRDNDIVLGVRREMMVRKQGQWVRRLRASGCVRVLGFLRRFDEAETEEREGFMRVLTFT